MIDNKGGTTRSLLHIALCSLKMALCASGLWIFCDIFTVRGIWGLISIMFQPPQPGMGGAFHVIYISLALMVAGGIGLVGGLIWGLLTSKESYGDKRRAGLIWLLLLTLLGAKVVSIFQYSPEWEIQDRDIAHLRVEEVAEGKLRVRGTLDNKFEEIARVETFKWRDEYGFEEAGVAVYVRESKGDPEKVELDYTMDIPEGVKRVVFGNGDYLLWGQTQEESLAEESKKDEEYELRRWYSNFEALWERGEEATYGDVWDDELSLGDQVIDEIRRVYLGEGEEGDGFFREEKAIVGVEDDFYKDRLSGRIKAFKVSYGDGSFMIVDNTIIQPSRIDLGGDTFEIFDKQEKQSRKMDIHVIIGEADGKMTRRVYKRK